LIAQQLGLSVEITNEELEFFKAKPSVLKDEEGLGEQWRRYREKQRTYAMRSAKIDLAQTRLRNALARAELEREEKEETERRARERAKPPPGTYAAALWVLKLREGHFGETTFNKHYRRAMQAAHPDTGGTKDQAQAVNAARALIKMRHGWK